MRPARIALPALLALTAAFGAVSGAGAQKGPSKIEVRAGDRVLTNRSSDRSAIRVLFVGNSLTYWNEMPWLLEQIAASGKAPVLETEFVGASGMSLRQHWERGRALRAIDARPLDYVVIQGQSTEPADKRREFMMHARLFDREIRSRGAKTVLFLTWATADEEQSSISEPYLALARELGAIVAPVGVAWQSLRSNGRELFDGSGLHPNLAGSYLSACVLYATLTGRSPVGLRHRFDVHFDIPEFYRVGLETERLSDRDAKEIQRAAWEAVAGKR